MKKKTIIWVLLLCTFGTVFITKTILAYKEKGAREQKTTAVTKPKVDLHTAVVTDNLEAVKQHIAAGADPQKTLPSILPSSLSNADDFVHKVYR